MNKILEISQLSKKFKNQVIAKELSFSLENREIVSIMGSSGAGKTTLLRMISGLEIPDSGKIIIDNLTVNSGKIFIEPYKRGIGYVFQNSTLWPHMTMEENINFALSEKYKSQKDEIVKISGIKEIMEKYPDQVSEGEGKRVSIVRAICSGAKLLLMDEPFSNLDEDIKKELMDLIKELHSKTELSILMVSHNIEENIRFSDKIFELKAGELYEKSI
jgi:ABC-type sugar transport system ATPase subunit